MKFKYLFFIIFLLCSCGTNQEPQEPSEPALTFPAIIESEEIEEPESELIEITTEEIIIEVNREQEAFNIINKIRNDNGLAALSWDDELYEVAQIRSKEASQKWSHTRPDGTHWSTLSPVVHGENLAKGYNTAQGAVDAWMNSEGHKANILRKEFTRVAISFYEAENGWFCCMSFGY